MIKSELMHFSLNLYEIHVEKKNLHVHLTTLLITRNIEDLLIANVEGDLQQNSVFRLTNGICQ